MTCCTSCSTFTAPASPLGRFRWFKRAHAWALARGNARFDRAMRHSRQAMLGALRGTVLEIGPGAGSSLPFFNRDVRWIGVEPNPYAHRHLEARAEALGLHADIREGVAERLPVPDASVDAVVSSLVLCTVSDVDATLAEIRRVLKPGGRFVFIEHVAAPAGSWLRRAQRAWRTPQAILGDGCRIDQETWVALDRAGFASLTLCDDQVSLPLFPLLLGTAVS